MDQILNKIFRYIPEWLFVVIILCGGLIFVFNDTPLVSICDAQIADFASGQNGKLFPRSVKVLNPLTGGPYSENNLKRFKNRCVNSIKGAGCYSYFKIIEGVLFDFKKLDQSCLVELADKPIMSQLFEEYLTTMTILAWGERPPLSQAQKAGWLTDLELKTFCKVKSNYTEFYKPEKWDQLVQKTLSQLIEDPRTYIDPIKTKKESFEEEIDKDAEIKFKKVRMDIKKAYNLSLLSMDCLYYQ
jgi:hypothetical protein